MQNVIRLLRIKMVFQYHVIVFLQNVKLSSSKGPYFSYPPSLAMDRQLRSPLLIESIASHTKLTASQTYAHLGNFLSTLPPSPARTQLERLTDALGVETGLIAPSEGDRREAERLALRSEARAKKRKARESAKHQEELEGMEGVVEGLEGEGEGEAMDEGGVGFEGEEGMDDKGDVEYEDVASREEDEDEPDNGDEKMEGEKE